MYRDPLAGPIRHNQNCHMLPQSERDYYITLVASAMTLLL